MFGVFAFGQPYFADAFAFIPTPPAPIIPAVSGGRHHAGKLREKRIDEEDEALLLALFGYVEIDH